MVKSTMHTLIAALLALWIAAMIWGAFQPPDPGTPDPMCIDMPDNCAEVGE